MYLPMKHIHDRPADSGAIAQLGERDVCNVEVAGSIPAGSIREFDGRASGVLSRS